MAEDIAPALLEAIEKDFAAALSDIEAKAATWPEAYDYASEVWQALTKALQKHFTSATLPDGRCYWNIADRVLRPMLEEGHSLVAEVAADVQQQLNTAAGLGLKAQMAQLDTDRVNGILNVAANAEEYDAVAGQVNSAIENLSLHTVDDTIQRNVEFQGSAGLRPKVIRRASHGCCRWCSSLAGTYTYPDVPKDVYRRHENCNCLVEYDPGGGRRQNVHTKRWRDDEAIEKRKTAQGIDIGGYPHTVEVRDENPENVMAEYLRTAKPGEGSLTRDNGYDEGRHMDEISISQWLHGNLGGDIVLLSEKNPEGVKNPDYLWRGKFWELKSPSTIKAIDSAFRGGLKQIEENPGGIIVNFKGEASLNKIQEAISDRFFRSGTENIDVLILQKGNLNKALRYKALSHKK